MGLEREDLSCCGTTNAVRRKHLSRCSRACEPQLLSPCAAATEPSTPRAPVPQQEKPLQEARELQRVSSPCFLQLKKAHVEQRRPNTALN